MKRPKEKQTPIFSKLQDILGENPSRVRADLDRAEAPPAGQSVSREKPLPGPAAVPARDDASPRPEDQEFNREIPQEATTVAEVPAMVILPPPGMAAVVNSLGMVFVLVPAGKFVMGSPDYEPGRNDDELPHEVIISRSFYLQTTPVTRGQWQAVMGRRSRQFGPDRRRPAHGRAELAGLPGIP